MRKLIGIKIAEEFPIYDITVENDHCFQLDNGIMAHNSLYPKQIISGGSGLLYSCNQAFIIGKAQEKVGTDLVGYNFIINVEKSRFVKEKSKFPFTVTFNGGIQKYSGLIDIAIEGGFVVKPTLGWYAKVDKSTGEIGDKMRLSKTQTDEFWQSIIHDQEFKDYVKKRYEIAYGSMMDSCCILENYEETI